VGRAAHIVAAPITTFVPTAAPGRRPVNQPPGSRRYRMRTRFLTLLTVQVALAACQNVTQPEAFDADLTPQSAAVSRGAIPGQFIVTLRDGESPAAVAADHGLDPIYTYHTVLTGFAGQMSDAARAGLLRDARVTRVEQDGIVTVIATQSNPTWGLDRIDQRRCRSTRPTPTITPAGRDRVHHRHRHPVQPQRVRRPREIRALTPSRMATAGLQRPRHARRRHDRRHDVRRRQGRLRSWPCACSTAAAQARGAA
jgi:hypothetical protein